MLEVTREIRRPFLVALMGDVERAQFTSLPGPSVFASDFEPDELKQTDVSGRLALVYDTRDNEYDTHQGLLLEAGTQVGSGGDGYTRLYTVLRGYLRVREGTVVAARLGAAGIVYGRNVIQHANPAGMTRALMAVVHEGASADEALALLSSA